MTAFRKLAAFAALGILTACGSSTATGGNSPTTNGLGKVDSIASEVPADIKAKGALQIGVDATYAPNEAVDPETGQIVGWDIELGAAIGKVLGVPFVFNNADF